MRHGREPPFGCGRAVGAAASFRGNVEGDTGSTGPVPPFAGRAGVTLATDGPLGDWSIGVIDALALSS